MIDVIGVTGGDGYEGVTTRGGRRACRARRTAGWRKVACIGAWHPAKVQYAVPRAGQNGYHHAHRDEQEGVQDRQGADRRRSENNARPADFDLTEKGINPVGGFPHYGLVKEDYRTSRACGS